MPASVAKPRPFTILGIDHLGLVAKDSSQAKDFFGELLGLPFLGEEAVAEQAVLTFMYESQTQPPADAGKQGGGRLEILEPSSETSPIRGFLEKRGGGIHHLAIRVDKLQAALTYLAERGVALIDQQPRRGAHHSLIAFIHPKATGGILVELVQAQS